MSSPPQTICPVPDRIAQLWDPPAEIALAVPSVPSTDAGGVDWPESSHPQQTTSPVPDWIAQLWEYPAEIALAVPTVPSTEAGGVDWPSESRPQQVAEPSVRSPHVCQ